jgi:putative membrane-bound dehydrogenase-like protein
MKLKLAVATCLLTSLLAALAAPGEKPLRVFLRAGVKTHGAGEHDHPRFLEEWKKLLPQRGAPCDGSMEFPTAAQLDQADVMVMFCQDGGSITPAQRAVLEKFLKRGGGMVVVHDAVCGNDPHWFKTIVGGAWEHGHSKWHEGNIGFYILDREHPITQGVSNFEIDDEIYHDLHFMPEARVLAASFHNVFTIAPQMWVYERTLEGGQPYRAFVTLLGHKYTTFEARHSRALLLRGIAWAGQRDVDSLLTAEEKASLTYPEGGPTAPQKSAEKLIVHPEFNVSLVASEPLINKPISIDWDAQGRLWVAETPEYPSGRRVNTNDNVIFPWRTRVPVPVKDGKEDRPARDRISYVEDTNGDGVADKKTVFFDGLELVTSLVFYKDGVIVAQAPDILWLRDTDGDGKADKQETLYTGFGTFDTHAVLSNLRWGLDGWVYATVGYSRGDIKSPDGSKSFGRVTEGVLRFKPDGSALEQVSSKGSNTWGMDFDWDNELFFTQATSGDHLNHVVVSEGVLQRGRLPSTASYYTTEDHKKSFPAMTWEKQAYVQIDVVGGFTAVSGSCLYTGGAWPEKFNTTHFLTEPTINIVHHDLLQRTNSTFRAVREAGREQTEFIASRDLWFRPIHLRVGPDGALYVVDFYNQAVVHNDTRGPRHGANNAAVRPDRDHYFGRVWRVQHKEPKPLPTAKLDAKDPAALVKALEHPNGWVRMTAHRLLSERGQADVAAVLQPLVTAADKPAYTRVHALWVLHNLGKLDPSTALAALADSAAGVRKNAAAVLAQTTVPPERIAMVRSGLATRFTDEDPRVRLHALEALANLPLTRELALALTSNYGKLALDNWLLSALLGITARDPLLVVDALMDMPSPALGPLMADLSEQIAKKQDPELAARLITTVAGRKGAVQQLQMAAMMNIEFNLKPEVVPKWTPELQQALQGFVQARNTSLACAGLVLASRWDTQRTLAADTAKLLAQLNARLTNAAMSDPFRELAVTILLKARRLEPEAITKVGRLLTPATSPRLQHHIVHELGDCGDPAVGAVLAEAYANLDATLQESVFEALLRRADWSNALLDAVKSGAVSLNTLGPTALHRLRHHGDKAIAARAGQIIDEVRGPEIQEKDQLIAKLLPAVQQPGDVAKGKTVFTQNCANCHKFKGEGRDVAPDLTGMGAHGPAELLVHILDPNRYVEANYLAIGIETQDGEVFDGIIGRENREVVVLRNAQGDQEIATANIKARHTTGLSLMPSGFETLGEEPLRDLLAFLCEGENRYRLLDLRSAFTANSTRGIYTSESARNETLRFERFGVIKVGDIPFEIMSPSKTADGNNVCVLRGGDGFAKSRPQKVEIQNVGVKASKLHFLGGVGGWAYPWGEQPGHNVPVMKVTVHFADGQTEELVLKNGQEFADYLGSPTEPRFNVPGSQPVPGLVKSGQVRWFTKPLQRAAEIKSISLESFDNHVAPTLVALTAEIVP